MNQEELIQLLHSDPSKTNTIVQTAYEKNMIQVLQELAKSVEVIGGRINANLIIKAVIENQDNTNALAIFHSLLSHNHNDLPISCNNTLMEASQSPILAAYMLLCKGTPVDVTNRIITINKLDDVKVALFAKEKKHPVLHEICELLLFNLKWENIHSMFRLITRVNINPHDNFITEVAKYDLAPDVFAMVINFAQKSNNKIIMKNIDSNASPCTTILKLKKNLQKNDFIMVSHECINLIEHGLSNEVWDILKEKLNTTTSLLYSAIFDDAPYNNFSMGKVILELAEDENIMMDLLKFINVSIATNPQVKQSHITETLVNRAMNNPNTIKRYPEYMNIIENINISPENNKKLDDYLKTILPVGYDDLENLFGNNDNWYKCAQNELEKEAGIKSDIATLVTAVGIMLGGGVSIAEVALKLMLPEKTIRKALDNEKFVDYVMQKKTQERKQKENQVKIPENKTNTSVPPKLPPQNIPNNTPKYHQKETAPKPPKTKKSIRNREYKIDIVTKTLFAEAESESYNGKLKVASTIWNRAKGNPDSLLTVIFKPLQYSCWNKGAERRTPTGEIGDTCRKIATQMVDGTFTPITDKDHYWNPSKCNPGWAYYDPKTKTRPRPYDVEGRHRFIKLLI